MSHHICSFPDCGAKYFASGLCSGHWAQRSKGRDLSPIVRGRTAEQRFWEKVEKTDTCWVWIGAIGTGHGYGNFGFERKTVRAHRFAYELLVGPIPDGLVLDHLCRNRACVNPDHLEPVPQAENVKRGRGPALAKIQNVDQTHCLHNHPLFGDNLYVQPKNGYRYCRTCQRRRRAEHLARMAEAS